jgi:hypothetical protein
MTNHQSLQALCDYLRISRNRIKNDPMFGRSVIQGRKGYIYVAEGYFVVVENATKRKFGFIRRTHLPFMEMTRIIIDDQPLSTKPASVSGEFRLDRMPTEKEAKAIRHVLQIREKRILSDEQKQALVTRFQKGRADANCGLVSNKQETKKIGVEVAI